MTTVETPLPGRRPARRLLRSVVAERWRSAAVIIPPAAVMLALFAYPFAVLLGEAFSSPSGMFGQFVGLAHDPVFRISLWNTFSYALVTAALTGLLGYPVALLLASVRPSLSGILLLLVMVPFWTSILVRSYAWTVLLGRHGIINTALMDLGLTAIPLGLMFNGFGVVVGMVHVMLPYMVLPIFGVISRLNKELLAAADSLGACRSQVFFRVLLPLTLPGVLGGFVLVFVLSLGFFITPTLLGGPRNIVTAMVIYDDITRQLAWDQAAAASIVLLLLTAGTFLVAGRIFGLRRHMSLGPR